MAPASPPPPFAGQERGRIESPPPDTPLVGRTGGARRQGSSSPRPSHTSRVGSLQSLKNTVPMETTVGTPPELPEELLMTVFGTLEIPDLVRAASVCTSWRSAYTALRSLGKHKQAQTPCLLYTSESAGDNVACLYSLVEKRVYRLTLPEPPLRRRFLIGSSLGFLVTVDHISEMHLVNPITAQQIALPSVTTMEYVKPIFDDSGAVHEYQYPCHFAGRAFFAPSIVARCKLREQLQIKAFLFHDTSTGSYIVALIHEPFNHLSFARVGDEKWTLLPPHHHYQDCTYKDGLLYAVDIKGEIHAFDLNGPAFTMKIIRGIDEDFYPDAIYIVEAPWGGLLLVSRFKEFEDPAEDGDPEIYVPHTTEIKLHRVDDGTERLVEIDCLPDHVLFLGHNHPLCLSAKDYHALKENHAYFTDDDEYNKNRKSSPRDIGVVGLSNNREVDLVSPLLWSNWPSPVWLTPSLTVMKLPSNDRWLSGWDHVLSRPSPTEATVGTTLLELPEDIMMRVFATLEIPDLVRAGAVCNFWHSAYTALRKLGTHKQPQTPCLFYCSESSSENVACLYSLVEKRVYWLTLPEPPLHSRFLIGSSLGLLVTVDERSEMHLVNPITGQQIALPSVTTMQHMKPICDDSGAVHKYEYSRHMANQAICPPKIIAPAALREVFHQKALVFYDTPTGSYIVVLIHMPFGQLSFARVGDGKWTWLPPHTDYFDCTYKDGLLYAATLMGEIHTFDLSGPAVTMNTIMGVDDDDDFEIQGAYILQAPWGGLLLVWRLKVYSGNPDDISSLTLHTKGIKIHEVDVAAKKLVEIDCLHGHALFLGHNQSLCLSTKECPALKENRVYFTDDNEYITVHKDNRRDIGLLRLDNNSWESLVFPQLWSNWPAPVWITPNLTMMKLSLNK
ncbi:uncharacterized protein LOC119298849 [Triticum dicoccoides]|uniref:uncharacterized protein LOC119298849 n=1 Tax=Triticum dicoccoides TaxID=85692 RepID=UPI00188F323A|nr:uncharacterized protein LOC119298849 [Triticum dicoccoides]